MKVDKLNANTADGKLANRKRCSLFSAFLLPIALFASCLQSTDAPDLEEYVSSSDVVTRSLSLEGCDMIIITLNGGIFKTDVKPEQVVWNDGEGGKVSSLLSRVGDAQIMLMGDFSAHTGKSIKIQRTAFLSPPTGLMVEAVNSNTSVWEILDSNPFSKSRVNGVTYGNGLFVAVGNDGKMAVSTDGSRWSVIAAGYSTGQSNFGADTNINAVAYGNDKFYAVGDKTRMSLSSDGRNWDNGWEESKFGATDASGNFYAIAYGAYSGGSAFVAGGAGGKLLYMPEGGEWQPKWIPMGQDDDVRAICYGPEVNGTGIFVAGGGKKGASPTAGIWYSAYGSDENWFSVAVGSNIGSRPITSIAFDSDQQRFVAVSEDGAFVSTDGRYWEAIPLSDPQPAAIAYGGGALVAVGQKMASSSVTESEWKDGDYTWTTGGTPVGTGTATAYGAGRFVVAGVDSSGSCQFARKYINKQSAFVPDEDEVSAPFSSMPYHNKLVINLEGGKFSSSGAGEIKNYALSGGTGGFTGITYATATKVSDTQVVITGLTAVTSAGSGQTITVKEAALQYKPTAVTVTADIDFGTSTLWAVASDNGGKYVVGGSDCLFYYNGQYWRPVPHFTAGDGNSVNVIYKTNYDIRSIAYGNGKWVAAGYQHTDDSYTAILLYSTDGVNWQQVAYDDTTFKDTSILAVVWTGTQFCIAGDNAKRAYSSDGAAWTPGGDDGWNCDGANIVSIAADGPNLLAVGANGKLAKSGDNGARWWWGGNGNENGFISSANAITFGNGVFVAAGSGGELASVSSSAFSNGFGGHGAVASWNRPDSQFGGSDILSLAYGGGKFVAVGQSGKVSYSTDGSSWKSAVVDGISEGGFTPGGVTGAISSVVYSGNGNTFVIAGNANNDRTGMASVRLVEIQ